MEISNVGKAINRVWNKTVLYSNKTGYYPSTEVEKEIIKEEYQSVKDEISLEDFTHKYQELYLRLMD